MKVNVGVGAYRCDEGMPFVLPCIRKAGKCRLSVRFGIGFCSFLDGEHYVFACLFSRKKWPRVTLLASTQHQVQDLID